MRMIRSSLLSSIDPIIRLQTFLRTIAAAGREVVRVPPFTATFASDDSLKYLSYAIPDDGAEARVEKLTVAPVGPDDLREATDIMRVAFGGAPLAAGEEPRAPRGGAVLARSAGTPVSAAMWTPVSDGISEIVGVATAEDWRRRGLAGVVTAAATHAAFEAGAVFGVLSPGDDTAQRVYARAGYRRVATMLHWSDPS